MKAGMLRESGQHDEALELYFQALATEPTSAMWWRGAALSAAAIGEREQAVQCIAQLEALRPGDPQVAQLRREVEAISGADADRATMPERTHTGGP
jgi:predicted TPR repeat methyltransferase